uniref:Transcription and mRNA export factor ENY2 n=1 Tax=Tetranychus urticae TaxID=32264 RepID=T1KYD8_TETUR
MDPVNEEVRAKAHQKLEETGKRDELKRLLQSRLVESQFQEKVAEMCKDYIKGKDLDSLSTDSAVDAMVKNIAPDARALVPDEVRKELVRNIASMISGNPPPPDVVPK